MALSKEAVIRAWKDETFRDSLPAHERVELPALPAGADGSELTDEQLEAAAGGTTPGCAVVGAFAAGVAIEEAFDD